MTSSAVWRTWTWTRREPDQVLGWSDLNDDRVKTLVAESADADAFTVVWPNIEWLADLFWDAQSGSSHERRIETWHHLVMTAGNFKRQGGTKFVCSRQLRSLVPPGSPVRSRA